MGKIGEMTDEHSHVCELSGNDESVLRSTDCWDTFKCSESFCTGKRYCPPCLQNVVHMSAELMGDY